MNDSLTRRQLRRSLLASSVGSIIEWYDFNLYGLAAALVIGPLFFPSGDPLSGTLKAFVTYAVGFAARPVGAAIFGHYGDRIGRKAVLITTLSLMGVATFGVGLIPTYDQVGIWGGVALVVLRVVQGLGVGGEWGGAALLTLEWGSRSRVRGFLGSWPQIGVPAGTGLAYVALLASTTLLGPHSYWGWRLPFLVSILLIGVGLYVRLGILETPVFSRLSEERRIERTPVPKVLALHWREVVQTALARSGQLAPIYIFNTFVLTYGTQVLRFSQRDMLLMVAAAAALSTVTTPLFGYVSDRLGRKRTYLAGAAVMIAFAPLYWALLDTRAPLLVALAVALSLPVHDLQYGPQAALIVESFTARVRFSGASLGYHLASLVTGGPALIVTTQLLATYHSSTPIALYMMACAAVGLIATTFLRDRSHEDLGVEYDQRAAARGAVSAGRAG